MIGLLMALQAASGTFEPPKILNAANIFRFDDISEGAATVGFAARMEITVDASGQPRGCKPVIMRESERLADYACGIAVRRGKYASARGPDGLPIAGVFVTTVSWRMADKGRWAPIDFDVVVTVDKLPKNVEKPVVRTDQLLKADGSVEACSITTSSGSAALDREACPPGDRAMPIVIDGQPVPGVRSTAVRFVVEGVATADQR